MDKSLSQYEILKTTYKVGHPILVKIIEFLKENHISGYSKILVETKNGVKGILEIQGNNQFEADYFITVIKNYNPDNNTLFLSSKLEDLKESTIDDYKRFYRLINEVPEGTEITGTVIDVKPFGLFIDIGLEYLGLIDIGHSSFNKGKKLPYDNAKWPKEGETIKCVISYYRFYNKQFGLGWLSD